MEKTLQKKGYKLTKPRLAIIKLLEKQHQPLTATDIFKKLKSKFDLASVYRNLLLFKKLNLVEEEKIKNETYYFITEKHHHHITCINCGHMECVPCKNINLKIKNFSKISHHLTLTGICKSCS